MIGRTPIDLLEQQHRSSSVALLHLSFFLFPFFTRTRTYIHANIHTYTHTLDSPIGHAQTSLPIFLLDCSALISLSLSFSLISLHRIRLKLRRLILHAREHISKVKQKDSISSPTRSSARSDYNKPNAKQNNVACVYTIARKFFPKVDKISSFFLPSFFPFFPTKNPLTIIRTRRREADYAFVAHR